MPRIRRRTESGQEYTTTYLELFFDLVFVFAITQVTQLLLAHLGWKGAGQFMALAIDYGGPLVTFWVPGRRRLAGGDWELGTGHFTERFALFVIIALGESVVRTGTTTAGRELDFEVVAAFCVAFASAAALWWMYFTSIAALAERALAAAANRTLMARDAYTYGHVLIIAGIILSAVGNEIVIDHPANQLPARELITVVAGPALYLLAQGWLRFRMSGGVSSRRVVGIVACGAVGLIGAAVPGLAVGALLVLVLVAVIVADDRAGARRRVAAEAPAR